MRILKGLLVACTFLASTAASAQDAGSVETLMRRDSILPPVLSWLQQQGSKLTLIGEEAGLKGYLVESPTGKMQSVYVSPDGRHIIAGILFEQGGKNVTGVQIGEMRKRFDDAAKALGADAQNSSPVADEKSPASETSSDDVAPTADTSATIGEDPVTSPPADDPQPTGEKAEQDQVDLGGAQSDPAEKGAISAAVDTPTELSPATDSSSAIPAVATTSNVVLPTASGSVEGAEGNPSDVWLSKTDRDEFLKLAEEAPYFEVGSRVAPVTLWMVADPKCPYCHAAWGHIESMVFDKKVKVRVILINALPGSEPFVREILASPDPARRWIVSKAGVNIEPTVDPNSAEWKNSEKYMDMNMEFARTFHIDGTPFLAYVAPDGRFYSVKGLPPDLDAFFAASGASSK